MAALLDSFIDQLQHRVWTQIVPLGVLAAIGGVLFRLGLEKLVLAVGRLFRGKPACRREIQDHFRFEDGDDPGVIIFREGEISLPRGRKADVVPGEAVGN